jgi:3'-phosphoadenosine 5'-phosphosulfate sulfotransferase (PAPS reductase)/FAD synthetase
MSSHGQPFFIEGPAVISLSGGRTSAYMLRRILDATLQSDVHVLFCNTGKEYEETLVFVHEIERRWDVNVHWLQYERQVVPKYKSDDVRTIAERFRAARKWAGLPTGKERGYRVVSFDTAARHGEPYENFVAMSGLPNPVFRTCTTEMKVRPMKRWMLAHGYSEWDMVMGIRADELRRVSKLRRSPPERWEHVMPLADAGVT